MSNNSKKIELYNGKHNIHINISSENLQNRLNLLKKHDKSNSINSAVSSRKKKVEIRRNKKINNSYWIIQPININDKYIYHHEYINKKQILASLKKETDTIPFFINGEYSNKLYVQYKEININILSFDKSSLELINNMFKYYHRINSRKIFIENKRNNLLCLAHKKNDFSIIIIKQSNLECISNIIYLINYGYLIGKFIILIIINSSIFKSDNNNFCNDKILCKLQSIIQSQKNNIIIGECGTSLTKKFENMLIDIILHHDKMYDMTNIELNEYYSKIR